LARSSDSVQGVSGEWTNQARVAEYLSREIPHRQIAEEMLLAALPERVERCIDLGTGDGRLLALVRTRFPDAEVVGLDSSAAMLDRAKERFRDGPKVELRDHDLRAPLSGPKSAEVVVSGLAIHHLEDRRKRELFDEVHDLLAPGGVFANLDLVCPASARLHERFLREIGRVEDDPADRVAGLDEQLVWLREIGFAEVDCHFKWLEMALMVAVKAPSPSQESRPRPS
jgi:tRNA (cmo5U34)-methyltransferase